jgi:hypothetical protein
MANDVTLEVVVNTKDETIIRDIEETMAGVSPQRWKDTRDIVAIITITSSVVELINALLTLKEKSSSHPEAPKIVIKNINRAEIELSGATEENLKALIDENDG